MPAKSPAPTERSASQLQALGADIRAHRKALGVSATAAAEAAGISRVTLHRVEKGEPSVTIGAWSNVLAALGMRLQASTSPDPVQQVSNADHTGWIPARVRLTDYPQLQSLAWHVHGTETLTPLEALDIYDRHARHLDVQAMPANEKALLDALRLGLQSRAGDTPHGV